MAMRFLKSLFKMKPEARFKDEVQDEKYRPGQVWSYKARSQDQGSVLLVGRVDRLPRRPVRPSEQGEESETVVSVMVLGLSIRAMEGGETLTEISHLPLDRLAMEASVLEVLKEGEPVPKSFEDGYRNWRLLFDRNAAAYYKYPVAQCVELAERTFHSQQRPRA